MTDRAAATDRTAALVRSVVEEVKTIIQPSFAVIMAKADENSIRISENSAVLARIEERLAALAIPAAAKPPRALNIGTIAAASAAAPPPKEAGAKKASAVPTNAMHLFIQRFSTESADREKYTAETLKDVRVAAGLGGDGELDEKGWRKVAALIWKKMVPENKMYWKDEFQKSKPKQPPTTELGIDTGDGIDDVEVHESAE